ncbi:hemerythrin domain-containing protein [Alkalibacillus aidingensis]|uniref:hemerythrin domain-containing protein n=1 Tax=Alkalibacillus aidingensis TaxID=2747607 RepID=UPI0016617E2A|nr:hemerythrin domain-containing protein [Alkalibacillus aidingensis]
MKMNDDQLSTPLQQLKNEHVWLRKEMDQFYEMIEDIEFSSGSEVVELFKELHEKIVVFTEVLDAHSKREEEALFPMMTMHLGENDRTIEEMEYEHHKAEQHLQHFLAEAHQIEGAIGEEDAQFMTVSASQAYATLTQHFAKEENILFPMAERILSNAEKGRLEKLLQI